MQFKLSLETAYTNTVRNKGERKVELPMIRAVGQLEVLAIEPNGDARISCRMDDAKPIEDVSDSRLQGTVEAEVNAIKRWRAKWRMSPSGVISEIAVDPIEGLSSKQIASIVESMRDSVVVFPDEPVGIGGSWKITSRVIASGVTWDREAAYTLRSYTDHNAAVEVAIVGRANSQGLRLDPNSSTRLTSATTNANGEITVPLNALVPTGKTRGTLEANFLSVTRQLRITSTVRTNTQFAIQPIAAPTADAPAASTPTGASAPL